MRKVRTGFLVLILAALAAGPAILVPLVPSADPLAPVGDEKSLDKEKPAAGIESGGEYAPRPASSGQPVASTHPAWVELEHSMRKDHQGLIEQKYASGRRSVYLDGRFAQTAAMVRDENGRMHIQCFSDYQALKDFLENQSPTTSLPAHENAASY